MPDIEAIKKTVFFVTRIGKDESSEQTRWLLLAESQTRLSITYSTQP